MRVYKYTLENVRDYVLENGKGTVLLSENYVNVDTKLSFKCTCDKEFKTSFYKFKSRNKIKCNKCNGINSWFYENTRQLFIDNKLKPLFKEFEGRIGAKIKLLALNKDGYKVVINIDKLRLGKQPDAFSPFNPYTISNLQRYLKIQGEGYKLTSTKYKNNSTKLSFLCSENHEFEMCWGDFQQGRGCAKCLGRYRKSHNEFISEVYDLIGDEYSVIGNYTSVDDKIKITHNTCNHEYSTTGYHFINRGQRCPRCNESRGEREIRNFLHSNDWDFEEEYIFEDCRNKLPLRFDFAVFNDDNSIHSLIEFDGKQHFEVVDFFGGLEYYEGIKLNDSIKNDYCKTNKINLLRIPYTKYNNIETILTTHL